MLRCREDPDSAWDAENAAAYSEEDEVDLVEERSGGALNRMLPAATCILVAGLLCATAFVITLLAPHLPAGPEGSLPKAAAPAPHIGAEALANGLGSKAEAHQAWPPIGAAKAAASAVFNGTAGSQGSYIPGWEKQYAQALFDNMTRNMAPTMNRSDGNVCADDEEHLQGLCYKKCSLLTNGVYPYRNTGMSCCQHSPCKPWHMRWKMRICSGYNVAGDSQGEGACPHPPGACLSNEELSYGLCFKKCSELTDGEFPNRVAPMTCCKMTGYHCFDPRNLKTSAGFQVGGGHGDGDKNTPDGVHGPMESLTEAKS